MKYKKIVTEMIKEVILEEEGQLFDSESAQDVVDQLKANLNVPFVQPQISMLGGKNNVSIIMRTSLDPKEKWINGIYQNSRYSQFSISKDGVIEQPYRFYKLPNFRKTKVKSAKDLISKLNQYFDKVN